MELTYRQKQQLLVSYRNDGYELETRLNAKGTVLDLEIARIELLMDESAVVEVIAPVANDVIDGVNSPTETAELEPTVNEIPDATSESLEPTKEPVRVFNQSSSSITPMVMVLYALAVIVVPVAILVGWLVNVSIKVVRRALPLIDLAITTTLEYLVNLVEFLFGSDYDEHADSYLEIKHLLRN